jgi:hypothetical protein
VEGRLGVGLGGFEHGGHGIGVPLLVAVLDRGGRRGVNAQLGEGGGGAVDKLVTLDVCASFNVQGGSSKRFPGADG